MGILSEVGSISEDRFIRYSLLALSIFYPGLQRVMIGDRQLFFSTDIAHVILLCIYYSFPYVVLGVIGVILKWTISRTAFKVNNFIVAVTTTTMAATFVHGLFIQLLKRWIDEELTFNTLPPTIALPMLACITIVVIISTIAADRYIAYSSSWSADPAEKKRRVDVEKNPHPL